MSIPKWVRDNWEGVMIQTEDYFGGHKVPGWKCKHCGGQVGSIGPPPRICPHCNHNSEGSLL